MSVKISGVEKKSPAARAGIKAGDTLIKIGDNEIVDVLDYRFYQNDERLLLTVLRKNGKEKVYKIKKGEYDELGLLFDSYLMDEQHSCRNKCIFCFIDQLPKGMRKSLYFKDDDARLSFLQGNYITLTNMSDHDIDKVIKYRLSPINISFQTTNPELRCKMLNNRFAGEALEKVKKFYEAGIEMNGQIVLCKGVNDGAELERSLQDLYGYLPHLKSVSIVPVGLSKYRDGLYPLEPFNKEDAEVLIDTVEKWQQKAMEEYGLHFVHASDEWYILAGRPFPEEDRYDGYLQLENGVGMCAYLEEQIVEAIEEIPISDKHISISVASKHRDRPDVSVVICP